VFEEERGERGETHNLQAPRERDVAEGEVEIRAGEGAKGDDKEEQGGEEDDVGADCTDGEE
jgi:hypothetical protein